MKQKTKKSNYYAFIVTDRDEIEYDALVTFTDATIADHLNGYTDNPYIFHQYINFYDPIIKKLNITYVTVTYENLEYEEFIEKIYDTFSERFSDEEWIYTMNISLTGNSLYLTRAMEENLGEALHEIGFIDEIMIPMYFEALELFKTRSQYFKEPFANVTKLIDLVVYYHIEATRSDYGFETDYVDYDSLFDWNYQYQYLFKETSEIFGGWWD